MFQKTVYCIFLRKKYRANIIKRQLTEDVLANVRNFESIPRLSGFPILGNWHLFKFGTFDGAKYHKALKYMYDSYGPLVIERIGWRDPVLHVFEPGDAQTIFKNEDKTPYIHPLMEASHINRKDITFMSPGFGHTNGEEWYRLVSGIRKLMMRPSSMQQYLPAILSATDEAIRQIERSSIDSGECVVKNLNTILGRWNLEHASSVCFEDKLRNDDDLIDHSEGDVYQKVLDANEAAFRLNRVMKFSLPFHKHWTTPTAWRQARMEKKILKLIKHNLDAAIMKLDRTVKDKTANNGDHYSFLISLIQNDLLTREDLMAVAASVILDGLYTMIPILLNAMYVLAKNPDVQSKTFEEIRTVSKGSKSLTKEMLNDLVYLKAVVRETFRMYPNGLEIARLNKKPLILSGYHIPINTCLSINMLVHFRNEKYFADPNSFKPERWLRTDETAFQNPMLTQTSFGIGARTCIGRRFAELCMYTFLFRILQEFRLKLPENHTELEHVFNTLIIPEGESPVEFHRYHLSDNR